MIAIHRIEDFILHRKGRSGETNWIEIEFMTAEGIQKVTLYFDTNTRAFKMIDRMRDLVAEDRKLSVSPFNPDNQETTDAQD